MAFFSRAKTAGTASPFVLLAAFLPYFAVSDPAKDNGSKVFSSLLSPVAFSLISKTIIEFESGFQGMYKHIVLLSYSIVLYDPFMCIFAFFSGVNWSNMAEMHNNISVWQLLVMLAFDTLLYAVLAWYFDKV